MVTAIEAICVVDHGTLAGNLKSSLSRDLPRCEPLPERTDRLAIVGSGPSVRDFLDEIRTFKEVWAINGAYDYLISQNIIPTGCIAMDPLPGLCDYLKSPQPETTFYVSVLVDPTTLDALEGYNVKLWFTRQNEAVHYPKGVWAVTGGTTAITRAPFLAGMLGFRDITIFGADSSFDTKGRYAYERSYQWDSTAPINWIVCNGEGPFATEICLLQQVSQLGAIAKHFKGNLQFRCGGLLDAYLRSPEMDESLIDAADAA